MEKQAQTPQLPQNAVKCRFFGQYLEQIIAKETKYPNSPTINTTTVLIINELLNYHLELKPLTKITDKDAIEIAKIISLKRTNLQHLKEDIFDLFVDDNLIIKSTVISLNQAFQHIQSKGYAVPYMQYSVEDLISFGWVKLL